MAKKTSFSCLKMGCVIFLCVKTKNTDRRRLSENEDAPVIKQVSTLTDKKSLWMTPPRTTRKKTLRQKATVSRRWFSLHFFCSSEHGPFLSFQKPAGKGNVLQVLREKHGSEQSTRSSSMTKKNKTTARFLSQPTQFPFTDQELSGGGGDTEFLGGSGSK